VAGGGSTTPPPAPVFPRFAVVASLDNTVSSYTVDSDTGQLRLRDYAIAGDGPVSVAMHPNQVLAYVVNKNANSVSVFVLGRATGFLSPLTGGRGSPFAVGISPTSVAVHPSGNFAYVTSPDSNSITAIATNSSTGALTPVPGSPFTPGASGSRPQSIGIDPSGRFAYVVNGGSSTVSTFNIDTATGALRLVSSVPTGLLPFSITIDSTGRFAYVANLNSDNVSAFRIDATTGTLASVAGSPFTVAPDGRGPNSVSIDPSGKFAIVANETSDNVSVFHIDAASGTLASVAGSPFTVVPNGHRPQSASIDPSGKFVYVLNKLSDNVSAFALDAATGALSPLSVSATVAARAAPASLAMTRDVTPLSYRPTFVAAAGLSSSLASGFIATHAVDAATGALTAASTLQTPAVLASVAAHPNGRLVYTANVDGNVSTFSINATTGALTEVGAAVPAGSNPASVTVDPSGRFVYVANRGTSTVAGSVSAYVSGTSGALVPIDGNPLTSAIDNFPAGTGPSSVAVHPSGRFAYAANSGSNNVTLYFIVSNTGELLGSDTVAAGTSPVSIAVDPSGRFVYVANNGTTTVPGSVSAYLVNPVDGRLTRIDADLLVAGIQDFAAGNGPLSVSVDATGRFLYVANQRSDNISAYRIDAATGALSHIDANPILLGSQDFAAGTSPSSVVADPSGQFAYVASGTDMFTFGIRITAPPTLREPGVGALFAIGTPLPTGNTPLSIAVTGTVQ